MTRIANHSFALLVALMLTAVSFHALIAVPSGESGARVEIA